MNSLPQIIGECEHVLERTRQLWKVFQAVTSSAELWPTERFRRRANSMHSVTFRAIQPCSVWSRRYVTAVLEELERLPMTLSAHLERPRRIRPGDKLSGVSLALF